MGCDAIVGDAAGLEYAEFYFVSGNVFYYSIEFSQPESFESGVWTAIYADFSSIPGISWGAKVLSKSDHGMRLFPITEVGVDFFANDTLVESMLVGIDDFYLLPEEIVPELTADQNGSAFELSFMREVSQDYNVLKSNGLSGWSALDGHSDITGDCSTR